MKRTVLLIVMILTVVSAFSESKEDKIRRMMDITGSGDVGMMVFESLMQQYEAAFPDIPQDYWDEVATLFTADDLINLIVPIYDRHFTSDEIDQLIEFYESEIGTKLVERTPIITQESMIAGQQYGEQIGRQIMNKLASDGYIDI